jgi:hypothetical protein
VATDFPVSLDMAAANFGTAERQTLSFGTQFTGAVSSEQNWKSRALGGDDE